MKTRFLAALLVASALVWGARASAQEATTLRIPVLTVRTGSVYGSPDLAGAPLNGRALWGRELDVQLRGRYGFSFESTSAVSGAELDRAIGEYGRAFSQGQNTAMVIALARLQRATRDAIAERDRWNDTVQASVEHALVFLAERFSAQGDDVQSQDAVQQLAHLNPSATLPPSEVSPEVRRSYAQAVSQIARGALTVETEPVGCTVFCDGSEAGTAPVELQDLVPGTHRIQARCAGIDTLLHHVHIAPRTRSTLRINAPLDAVVRFDPPGFEYSSPSAARRIQDAAALGRALGARRVILALPIGRAEVIDTDAAVSLGEANPLAANSFRDLVDSTYSPSTARLPTMTIRSSVNPHPSQPTRPTDTGRNFAAGGMLTGGPILLGASAVMFFLAREVASTAEREVAGMSVEREHEMNQSTALYATSVGLGAVGLGAVVTGLVILATTPHQEVSR